MWRSLDETSHAHYENLLASVEQKKGSGWES
jgi:hypothetical protein